jgi:general secretion pathway protein G
LPGPGTFSVDENADYKNYRLYGKKVCMLRSFPRSTSVWTNIKSIRWGLAIPGGWFVIFISGAIFLPSADAIRFAPEVLALIIVWLVLTAVALSFYFYRAWRRLPLVSNKVKYVAWLSFACVFALAGTLVWLSLSACVISPRQAREHALRHNLQVMRALINQYTLDKRSRPQSLNDLMAAGYIRQTPLDPMTSRSDSWILEWSNDPKIPGIKKVRSGSSATSRNGTACRDW